jgi:Ca2+-binding EF-hand superfamily protein
MQRRILTCMAALAATTMMAHAAGNPADYDGDGRISREEFQNQAARASFSADKNNNGAIDEGEFRLTAEQRKALDTNGDGRVTVEELQAGQVAGFAEIDKNGNGFIDADEMKGGN